MKISVKKEAVVNAVRKLSAGVGKETPIITTVVKTSEGYVGSLRVDGEVQVCTRFRVEAIEEGEIQVVSPTLLVGAVNSLARLGEEVVFEFSSTGEEIHCGSGSLTVPRLSQDVPQLAVPGERIGSITISSAQLKEALSVRSFIVPAKDSSSWMNCVGIKVADEGVRFLGSCDYGLMIADKIATVQGLTGASLAIPVLLLNKVVSLLDEESVSMHVFGKQVKEAVEEDGQKVEKIKTVPTHISIVDGNSIYMLPLCASSYGNIDAIAAGLYPMTSFSASVVQKDLVNAISIISASGSNTFTIDMVNGKFRVADDSGINYVDIDSEYTGELVRSKFACGAVLNGITAMGEKIRLQSNAKAERAGANMILFASPDEEDSNRNTLATFLPVLSNAAAEAQNAQIKKKTAIEKAEADN